VGVGRYDGLGWGAGVTLDYRQLELVESLIIDWSLNELIKRIAYDIILAGSTSRLCRVEHVGGLLRVDANCNMSLSGSRTPDITKQTQED
jgi:hypothetical protein